MNAITTEIKSPTILDLPILPVQAKIAENPIDQYHEHEDCSDECLTVSNSKRSNPQAKDYVSQRGGDQTSVRCGVCIPHLTVEGPSQ